jgi:single-stranded-DNA-specific exonuclease
VVQAETLTGGHVRCLLGDDSQRLKAIAFRAAETALGACLLEAGGRRLHVAGTLEADDWQDRRGVQLLIEDAAPAA